MLCEILRNPNYFCPENRMMPNANGVQALTDFFQNYSQYNRLNQVSRSTWFQFISNEEVFRSLYFGLENGGRQRLESVRERAKILVNMIRMNLNITKITIMDGHGRFLFALLEALFKTKDDRLMNIDITVVDIDRSVHQWHELFFPADIRSVHSDIYDYQKRAQEDTLTYFNFCGIGGKTGLERFLAKLHSSCLLSFSTRGYKGERSVDRFFPTHLRRGFQFETVTSELKFMTISITAPPSPPPFVTPFAPSNFNYAPPALPSTPPSAPLDLRTVVTLPSAPRPPLPHLPPSAPHPPNRHDFQPYLDLAGKIKALTTLKALKDFIAQNNLTGRVSSGTGGRSRRTLDDIRRDICIALRV
jgi:hypothetical protein